MFTNIQYKTTNCISVGGYIDFERVLRGMLTGMQGLADTWQYLKITLSGK